MFTYPRASRFRLCYGSSQFPLVKSLVRVAHSRSCYGAVNRSAADCMTFSEAAIERSTTSPIKIGYWNVGLQQSQLDCDGPVKQHRMLLKDIAQRCVEPSLHALWFCEVGGRNIGSTKEHNHKGTEDARTTTDGNDH